MSLRKYMTWADLLFGIQMLAAILFGCGQFLRMLSTSEGVSVTWFVCWEVFLILNLVLAIQAHKNKPSRVTIQTVTAYAIWTVVVTLDLGTMCWKSLGIWNFRDTITIGAVTVGVITTVMIASSKKLPITDPIVKGYLALFFKTVPQLVLAYNIARLGGAGLAGTTVLAGHLAVLTRLGQLWFSIGEAGWDRNRKASMLSEIGNEGSWVIVTIIWLLH